MTALFDSEGWYRPATHHPSPNCNDRPDGELPSLIVLHNISLPPNQYGGPGILQLFSNQLNPDEHPYYATIHTLRVSAHFLIRRDGQLLQFVPVLKRAWHAGASHWRGREQCNDFSVGIELEGCDTEAFTSQQYQQLNSLLAALQQQWPSLQAVTGHSDIAPGRKTDPGPCFDWQQVSMPHQAAQ